MMTIFLNNVLIEKSCNYNKRLAVLLRKLYFFLIIYLLYLVFLAAGSIMRIASKAAGPFEFKVQDYPCIYMGCMKESLVPEKVLMDVHTISNFFNFQNCNIVLPKVTFSCIQSIHR